MSTDVFSPVAPPVAQPFAALAFPVLRDTDFTEVAERARVQGHAAGYAAGRREATATLDAELAALHAEQADVLAAARAEIATAAALLRSASAAWSEAAQSAGDVADQAVLAAAVELATLIVGAELADHERSALAAARRALATASDVPVQALHLHPADLAVVAAAGDIAGVRLVPDPTLQRGDALADLPDGVVDARIGTAVDRVRLALLEGDA
jgi:flagellar assembly protein FliH